MKNLFGRGISQALESSRRQPSTPTDSIPERVITLVGKLLNERIDRQLREIASSTTGAFPPARAPSSSTSPLTPLGEGPLPSEKPDSPPSASTAIPRERFEPWRSPAFAPDGSRYLRVATSSPRASTSQRSKWASVSGRLRASDSGCSSRVEFLGRFQGKRALSFSTMPETPCDTDYPQRYERGLWLGLLRMLSALSLEAACERARRVSQSHPGVPWSVASAAKPSRLSLVKLPK